MTGDTSIIVCSLERFNSIYSSMDKATQPAFTYKIRKKFNHTDPVKFL